MKWPCNINAMQGIFAMRFKNQFLFLKIWIQHLTFELTVHSVNQYWRSNWKTGINRKWFSPIERIKHGKLMTMNTMIMITWFFNFKFLLHFTSTNTAHFERWEYAFETCRHLRHERAALQQHIDDAYIIVN